MMTMMVTVMMKETITVGAGVGGMDGIITNTKL
jgi:hypothetical protein